jgi:hypothetical protein
MMKSAHCVPDEVFKNIPKEEKNQNTRTPMDSLPDPNTRKAIMAPLSPDSRAAIKTRNRLRNALLKQEDARRLKKKNSFLKKKALQLATPSEIQVKKSFQIDTLLGCCHMVCVCISMIGLL